MKVAIISPVFDLSILTGPMKAKAPEMTFVNWPEPGWQDAEVAVCWKTPPEAYAQMPRLRLIQGIAAGVDNILVGTEGLDVPVCRVVDPDQGVGMFEYVLWATAYFHRHFDAALQAQREHRWHRHDQIRAADWRVGVMGLGALGGHVARELARFGYDVRGWSRQAREIEGVKIHAGLAQQDAFLAELDTLVCLLPLTDETRGILDQRLFDALPRGSTLVHCGRGDHLVEADLVQALESGQLRGAVIDVFSQEPMAADNPLWDAPGLVVTPHMASVASWDCAAGQIIDNIRRIDAGQAVCNQVDVRAGY